MNAAIRMRQLQQQASQIQSTNYLQQTTNLFKQFKQQLEEFASSNAKQIDKDPDLRRQFTELTNQLGIDPLSSANCVFSKVLSDFYYRLAIKIVDYCERTGHENIDMCELLQYLNAKIMNTKEKINEEDVEKSLKTMNQLNGNYKVEKRNGKLFINMGRQIYNEAQEELIRFVQNTGKIYFAFSVIPLKLQSEVENMLQHGMLALDEHDGEVQFYILSLC